MHQRTRPHTMALLGLTVILACQPTTSNVAITKLPPALSLGAMSVEQYVADASGQQAFRTLAQGFQFDDANESISMISSGPSSNGPCPSPVIAIGITPGNETQHLVHNKGTSDLDNPAHGPNNNGYALARIRALDSECGTGKLNMAPHAVYYVIARLNQTINSNDPLKYEVRLVDSASVSDKTPTASPTHLLTFNPCEHTGDPQHTKPEARIKDKSTECDVKVTSMALPPSPGDAAVWIACSNDCCYADPPVVTKSDSGSVEKRKAPAKR